jgi:hypothetical protein
MNRGLEIPITGNANPQISDARANQCFALCDGPRTDRFYLGWLDAFKPQVMYYSDQF